MDWIHCENPNVCNYSFTMFALQATRARHDPKLHTDALGHLGNLLIYRLTLDVYVNF